MARTPKARALGAMLRQAREQARDGDGLVLRELAAMINKDIGVLSRWETGDRTPKPEQVAQILTKLGVDGDRYEEVMSLAYGTNESQWVAITLPEQRQQMAAYVDWEQNATRIVEVAPLLVPGLLQTSDYIRSIMTAGGVPAGDIASRVTSRIGRRDVLTKTNPARLLVLLGQSALNQDIGGPDVSIAQLRYLLEMAALPNIDLRIVPDHSGWHPGLEGAFALIDADRATQARDKATRRWGPDGSPIVFLETRRSMLILHEDADVEEYQRAVGRVMSICLTAESSAKYVFGLLNRLEQKHDARNQLAEVES